MSKERFEWLYNETMLKHYMVDNQNNIQLGYEAIVNLLNQQNKQIADLEAKLAESEKSKESYRLQNDEHHLQLCQFYSRLGVEAFGSDIHEKALETLMTMKEKLADKEKENELMAKTLRMTKFIEKEINQDKISFAVEQLEKVKELILKECFEASGKGIVVRYYVVYHIFDNQINILRNNKDGIH